jgi:hypothetical protein
MHAFHDGPLGGLHVKRKAGKKERGGIVRGRENE